MQKITVDEKEAMNLKESREGYTREFGGRKKEGKNVVKIQS